jgi:hypothetical protein
LSLFASTELNVLRFGALERSVYVLVLEDNAEDDSNSVSGQL